MEKIEFRVLIKHCFLMKENTVETKQWLDKHYPNSAPSRQMVEKWIEVHLNVVVPAQMRLLLQKTSQKSTNWL